MSTGGCFCGAVKYEFSGEVAAKALCHCTDCRKNTGSPFSTNIIVPEVKVTAGQPKTFTKKVDSGNDVTIYFCGDCGSLMWRSGKSFGDNKVIRVGTLDDLNAFETYKPAVELYAPERPSWQKKVDGTDEKPGMP